MKAVILAAGMASRLRPLTDNTPKCLLKAGSKTILERTIENIIANGIEDIVIVTGFLEHMIRNYVAMRFPGTRFKFCHNERYASTNNIYSLWLAAKELEGHAMLLMDSDIVFDGRVITRLLNSGHSGCLALKRHDVSDEEIKVRTDERGCVREISKLVKPSEAAGESVGIELFGIDLTERLFSSIHRLVEVEKRENIFYEVAFQELADNNYDIFTVDITDYFCMEVDTADDLKSAAAVTGD
ncbi:MAG: phosphocholine cytidylyltransferase family protein [Bacteroidales bacterium]|nr:phosphocholine cytidylyltransferase family protein [Bacteroidales bacterium]